MCYPHLFTLTPYDFNMFNSENVKRLQHLKSKQKLEHSEKIKTTYKLINNECLNSQSERFEVTHMQKVRSILFF